jgi:hypothetical protein
MSKIIPTRVLFAQLVISLNLVLAGLRLGLKNRQVGEKWVSDDCSYLCKGLIVLCSVAFVCFGEESNTQTHYQLTSHLQSNTLELDNKAQTLSYEHYSPYGGTAIIAGKDKTQVQQKRYHTADLIALVIINIVRPLHK